MITPDDPSDELDRRPLQAVPYWDVVVEQDRRVERMKRDGIAISEDAMLRMRYVEAVLLYGNCSGRSNPTINLPVPFTLADILSVIGQPDDAEPGSDASWRAMRKKYDATHGGRLMAEGRTR